MDATEQHERDVREFLAKPPFGYRNVPSEYIGLFASAFVHDSYSNESGSTSNERLEFLGDSVLELAACHYVYSSTDYAEGKMTDFKQDIVCNHNISEAVVSYGLDIDGIMMVGNGHTDPVTKIPAINENMRADAFEALLAAIYMTYGLDEVFRIVREILINPKRNKERF